MRKATEMAIDSGAIFDEEAKLFVFDEEELMAFYHAARAEALREAADEVHNRYNLFMEIELLGVITDLRAMADREVKE